MEVNNILSICGIVPERMTSVILEVALKLKGDQNEN